MLSVCQASIISCSVSALSPPLLPSPALLCSQISNFPPSHSQIPISPPRLKDFSVLTPEISTPSLPLSSTPSLSTTPLCSSSRLISAASPYPDEAAAVRNTCLCCPLMPMENKERLLNSGELMITIMKQKEICIWVSDPGPGFRHDQGSSGLRALFWRR